MHTPSRVALGATRVIRELIGACGSSNKSALSVDALQHLDSDAAIANHAVEVAMQAGFSHAMPPGNVTEMTPEERALIVAWFREAGG